MRPRPARPGRRVNGGAGRSLEPAGQQPAPPTLFERDIVPKPTDTWMPLYIGDWRSGTARMTLTERGAYLALIADYWISGPPPDDDARLALIVGTSPQEWAGIRPAVAVKFQIAGGLWRHRRVESELAKAIAHQAQRQARTAAATAARWRANGHDPVSVTDDVTFSDTETPSPSPSPKYQVPSPSTEVLPRARKARAAAKPNGHGVTGGSEAFSAYSAAHLERYGVEATRNARVNSIFRQFVRRVPEEEAPAIAAWYVRSGEIGYVRAKHPPNLLLRDAEKLRTEWLTGRHGTTYQSNPTWESALEHQLAAIEAEPTDQDQG